MKHTHREQKHHRTVRCHSVSLLLVGGLILLLVGASYSGALTQKTLDDAWVQKAPRDEVWDVELFVSQPGGKTDYAIFGGAPDATDGPPADIWDMFKPPAPPLPPYLRAWFDDNIPAPYNYLIVDYRHHPDVYKVWNLSVQWTPSDYVTPTPVTITWQTSEVNTCDYTTVMLCTKHGMPLANMRLENTYTFTCPALTPQQFKIIASMAAPSNPVVDLTVVLQGPYNGATMKTLLNSNGHLPLQQPYSSAPWLYTGAEQVPSIPSADVVDWVLVELRDATTASQATTATRVARQAAFLLKNGTVVGMDGISHVSFTVTPVHQLFVVIWHRNHLAVLSNYPLTHLYGVSGYDFSLSHRGVYGGTNAEKQIGSLWVMAGGDGNADGQVNNADKNDVWRLQAGTSGYLAGDFTLDGQVNNQDKNDVWVSNAGWSSQLP